MSDKPAWLTAHGRPWTPGDERQVFETGWIRVIDQTATAPTGRPAPYGLVRFKVPRLRVMRRTRPRPSPWLACRSARS